MSADENKAIVRRYIQEVLNGGDLAAVDQVMAPRLASHFVERTGGDLHWSPEKEKDWITSTRSEFPDAEFSPEDLIADGARNVIKWYMPEAQKLARPQRFP